MIIINSTEMKALQSTLVEGDVSQVGLQLLLFVFSLSLKSSFDDSRFSICVAHSGTPRQVTNPNTVGRFRPPRPGDSEPQGNAVRRGAPGAVAAVKQAGVGRRLS